MYDESSDVTEEDLIHSFLIRAKEEESLRRLIDAMRLLAVLTYPLDYIRVIILSYSCIPYGIIYLKVSGPPSRCCAWERAVYHHLYTPRGAAYHREAIPTSTLRSWDPHEICGKLSPKSPTHLSHYHIMV